MFENKTSAHFLIAKDIFVCITCSWRMNIIISDIEKSIAYPCLLIFFLTDHRPVSVYRLVVMNYIFSGLFWSRFSVVYQTENWATRPRLSAGPALLMLGQQCAGCQVWHIYIYPPTARLGFSRGRRPLGLRPQEKPCLTVGRWVAHRCNYITVFLWVERDVSKSFHRDRSAWR